MARTLTPSYTGESEFPSLWTAGVITAVLAVAANALIYGIARLLGTIPRSVLVDAPSGKEPITLTLVVVSTLVSAIAGTFVYALLRRRARQPERTFRIVGMVLLALSLMMPLSIPDAPLKMVLTLELMHGAAACLILVTLALLTTPSQARPE